MKKAIFYLFIILFCFFISIDVHAQTGSIIVKINGIDELKGKIFVGLYNKAEDFPKIKRAFKGHSVQVNTETIKYIFSDIPTGEYAIAVIHDKNSNGELDTNFLGIPTEGYCFSKNAKGMFGPPDFDKAKFSFEEKYTAEIKMIY